MYDSILQLEDWLNIEGYGLENHKCDWIGVVGGSFKNDWIIKLELFQNNLRGELPNENDHVSDKYKINEGLPTEISSLVAIEWLYLYTKRITGTILGEMNSEIHTHGNLQSIKLYDNKSIGTIPSSIWALRLLRIFDFGANQFIETILLKKRILAIVSLYNQLFCSIQLILETIP